ncbi:MAG TPA: winged helix-turn-helix domain-containing protein [Nitrosopumilaceae archaeon]|nr:winged helix-turn-helix domain-containing protein [Nitrosopumilaceae archaeon]
MKELFVLRVDQESNLAKNKSVHAITFNIIVIKRVLIALHESGPLKRTNLSGKTGLSYNKCIKYINFLQLMGWVEIIFDTGHYVIITEKGIKIIETLSGIY